MKNSEKKEKKDCVFKNLFIILLIPSQLCKILEFQLTSSRFCEKNGIATFDGLKDFTAVLIEKIKNDDLRKEIALRFNVYRVSRES